MLASYNVDMFCKILLIAFKIINSEELVFIVVRMVSISDTLMLILTPKNLNGVMFLYLFHHLNNQFN